MVNLFPEEMNLTRSAVDLAFDLAPSVLDAWTGLCAEDQFIIVSHM